MSADLRDRLKAADVAAGRVYRDERPQGSLLSAVRLQVASDPRPSTYEGRQVLRGTLVQADCMAASRGEADELAESLIAAAEPEGVVGTTRFARSFVEASRTYSDREDNGAVTYVTSLDLRVWHQPAA
ncbi:hypothetical protein [Sphingomonas immobilis]|uniref:DUF3168 domain-containing protein n=1 Tax=Sphingomonas immobilis TaxID=3063997 RepID=A0ABT8ZU37_9SPHN|nr:hypothetical protein [Sphingomonas sp. CA1-15]MDO7841080.1 hypothetical protein [Sphingomonas sp. CA1-15]